MVRRRSKVSTVPLFSGVHVRFLRQCLIFRSFIEQPIVMQSPNENTLTVTWSEAYLHLIKCVDYFYVQYALAEGEDENG